MTDVIWREVGDQFGTSMRHGSCNAVVGGTVCGYPRNVEGRCGNGHPAPPQWSDPAVEDESA